MTLFFKYIAVQESRLEERPRKPSKAGRNSHTYQDRKWLFLDNPDEKLAVPEISHRRRVGQARKKLTELALGVIFLFYGPEAPDQWEKALLLRNGKEDNPIFLGNTKHLLQHLQRLRGSMDNALVENNVKDIRFEGKKEVVAIDDAINEILCFCTGKP